MEPHKTESFVEKIKNAYMRHKEYFTHAKKEIDDINIHTLYIASVTTMCIILLFVCVSHFVLENWHFSLIYPAFFLCVAIIAVVLKFFGEKLFKAGLTTIMCGIFTAIVIAFVIILDVISYPNDAATFSGIFLTAMPIVFIVPIYYMAGLQIAFVTMFSVITLHFKTPAMADSDIFHVLVGLFVGEAIYVIVTNMRIKEFLQKNKYRVSSETDALTQIYNRATSEKLIDNYLKIKQDDTKCAFIITDVDNFKHVNDRLGHSEGDKVLKAVAEILTSTFRQDDICGRFGGDEFIVFVKDIRGDEFIESKCHYINQCLEKFSKNYEIPVSCSMGAAIITEGTATCEELFRVADKGLYEAKAFGKNTYVSREFGKESLAESSSKPIMVIVDDIVLDLELLGMQFDEYITCKFSDATAALQYINENHDNIGIILLDIVMPNMDGFEMLKKLKGEPHTAHIPVIAVSADATTEARALECGADDMITKPIVPATARLRVENLMKRV